MYQHLSNVLHESQVKAAKKLGELENAFSDEYSEPITTVDQQGSKPPKHGEQEVEKPVVENVEWLTLREFQIW